MIMSNDDVTPNIYDAFYGIQKQCFLSMLIALAFINDAVKYNT
jgi:hypothetical protein